MSPKSPLTAICRVALALGTALFLAPPSAPHTEGAEPLPHRRVTLDLPGPPSALVPADLDGDGLWDLLVVLVYTEYEEIAFERFEGFVQLTEVVPALSERREIRAYLARADGSYGLSGEPLELPTSVITIAAGPPGLPVVALTDDGLSELRLRQEPQGAVISFEPLIHVAPVLRGARAFLPDLHLMEDLDGDGAIDLLLPAREGPSVHLASGGGLQESPASRLALPGDERGTGDIVWRHYPIPRIEDLDGDRIPDLIVGGPGSESEEIHVLRGAGGGRFLPPHVIPVAGLRPRMGDELPEPAFLGDLDGEGSAELAMRLTVETEGHGLKEAKKPRHLYAFYRLGPDLVPEPEPYREIEVLGYPFEGHWIGFEGQQVAGSAGEFRDLDGDGLRDLITMTLDFSVFQLVRILATKRIGVGLEFHIWAQDEEGGFRPVPDLNLSDKTLLDLNDLKLDRLGNFAGDFDGDGRLEFLALKGGRTLQLHRGRPGCAYSRKPDLELRLQEEPQDPGLMRVRDLDGDGRADLAVTLLRAPEEPGLSAPVALDLYLSGGTDP